MKKLLRLLQDAEFAPLVGIVGHRINTGVEINAVLATMLEILFEARPDLQLVLGGCPTGADYMAESLASSLGIPVIQHGAEEYWLRVQRFINYPVQMLDGLTVLLAFPLPSSDIRFDPVLEQALRAGIPTAVVEPTGMVWFMETKNGTQLPSKRAVR